MSNTKRILEIAGVINEVARSEYGKRVGKAPLTKFQVGVHMGLLDYTIEISKLLKNITLNVPLQNELPKGDKKKLEEFAQFIKHMSVPRALIKTKDE